MKRRAEALLGLNLEDQEEAVALLHRPTGRRARK